MCHSFALSYVYGDSSAECKISSADLLRTFSRTPHTYCLLLNLPLSAVKSLSVMPAGSPKSLLAFWGKTCPETAIKNPLWHHRGKSCWHSYHMVCVDAASEGLSSPTWLMVWQEPACRRVESTLIKSVPLLNTSRTSAKTAAATQSDGQVSDKEDMPEKQCAEKCFNLELMMRLFNNLATNLSFFVGIQHHGESCIMSQKESKACPQQTRIKK